MNATQSLDVAESILPVEYRPASDCAARHVVREPWERAAGVEPVAVPDVGLLGLLELILKDRSRLDRLLRAPSLQTALLPRLLGISLAGFVLFGCAMALVLTVAGHWPALTAIEQWLRQPTAELLRFNRIADGGTATPWLNGDVPRLVAAYAFGLVAATCVCLPSLYFYCLLSRVRMTMVDVVLHAVKSKAVAAVALVGILPIYVALALGAVIFGVHPTVLAGTLLMGLMLPFVGGLFGTESLYRGFNQLADALPAECGVERKCFLRRLVLSWSACYSVVMPVMIFSLWQALGAG